MIFFLSEDTTLTLLWKHQILGTKDVIYQVEIRNLASAPYWLCDFEPVSNTH